MINIKVFLASSITEFKSERMELSDYFRMLNDIYIDNEIYFKLFICEDFPNNVSRVRKQEEFNEHIREAEHFYALFGMNAGEITIQEFDVAYDSFKSTGKPMIYTYFYQFQEGQQPDIAVSNFMNRLDVELGHYYTMFSHLDSVKLNIILRIVQNPVISEKLSFRDGKVKLGEQEILSLDNIPIYNKNKMVQEWKSELDVLNCKFAESIALIAKDSSQELKNNLFQICADRNYIEDNLHKLENDILGLCQNVTALSSSGRKMTWRELEASKLVDLGEYDAALEILRDSLREKELYKAEMVIDIGLNRVIDYISEDEMRISTLKAKGISWENLSEMRKCYEKITELIFKYKLPSEKLVEYVWFLKDTNDSQKAIEVGGEIWTHLNSKHTDDEKTADLAHVLGAVYMDSFDIEKAIYYVKIAIDLYDSLSKNESKKYNIYRAECYMLYANALKTVLDKKNLEKSFKFYGSAISILEQSSKSLSDEYSDCLGGVYINLADLYHKIGDKKNFEIISRKGLNLYREREKERFNVNDLARIADCEVSLAMALEQNVYKMDEAKLLYEDAFNKYLALSKYNPEMFEPGLAMVAADRAMLLNSEKKDEALDMIDIAYKIYIKLFGNNRSRYKMMVAMICANYGTILKRYNLIEAEGMYEEAMKYFYELSQEKSGEEVFTYLESFAEIEDMVSVMKIERGESEKGKKLHDDAKEIFISLIQKDPIAYMPKAFKVMSRDEMFE